MKQIAQFFRASLLITVAVSLVSCASSNASKETASSAPLEIYEVHKDGRMNVFYDRKLYMEFLELGETPYRLTRIGAGPNGQTIVFGLTKSDKKMKKTIPAIDLYDGKLKQDAIYAEMRMHDRIYVFNSFKDMEPVRAFGHPNYMYTQIGAGPKGETVVYVLNKSNKKKRPDALIEAFKTHNS